MESLAKTLKNRTNNKEPKEHKEHKELTTALKNIFCASILAVIIFALAVTFTLYFKPLYYVDMDRYNLSETYGVSNDEIKENYDALIHYNIIFFDDELEFPTFPMSENARTHFAEVKDIFISIQWSGLICLILFSPILMRAHYNKEYRWLKYCGIACIAVPIVIGIVALVFWDQIFILFHQIFFANDYWLFDPVTDPIINFLPDEYFRDCAILIVAIIVLGGVICLYIYRRVLVWLKNGQHSVKKKYV